MTKKNEDNKYKIDADFFVRRIGYFAAIIFTFVWLYVNHNLTKWNIDLLDFVQPEFDNYLWIINISAAVTILTNLLLIFYDERLFKAFIQLIQNIFTIVFFYIFLVNFPFDFQEIINKDWVNTAAKGFIIFIMIAIAIGSIAELVKATIKTGKLCKEEEKEKEKEEN